MLIRIGKILDAVLYWLLAAFVVRFWHNDLRHWIAMPISLGAFVRWMVARKQLGASFAIRAEARKLVTSGLYSKIRNPIYFFAVIAYAAALVAGGWYFGLLIFLIIYTHQLFRIRNEERVLREAFGEEYLAYKARTWF